MVVFMQKFSYKQFILRHNIYQIKLPQLKIKQTPKRDPLLVERKLKVLRHQTIVSQRRK